MCRKNYIGAHLRSQSCNAVEFYSYLSAIYTKWGAQTFPLIFGLFAIFDHNFANTVVPPSDRNKNYRANLKVQSFLKNGENRIKIDP